MLTLLLTNLFETWHT